jgi:hypothetical protein
MEEKTIKPQITEIIIEDKEQKSREKNVFCETFSYQPENIKEMVLGNLYAAGQLQFGSSAPSHILNLLSAIIKREYYSRPKRKAMSSLKEGLKKANASISDLIKGSESDWLDKINFVCIAIAGNNLYFTKIGEARVMLLRDGKMTDLSKNLIAESDNASPQKIFQSIAAGKICPADQIILTTADVFKHIPQKGLKQILERKEIAQLEKLLRETKDISPQGIIVIEAAAEKETLAHTASSARHTDTSDNKTTIISVPQKNIQPQQPNKPGKIIDALKKNYRNAAADASLVFRSLALKIRERARRTKNLISQQKKEEPLDEDFAKRPSVQAPLSPPPPASLSEALRTGPPVEVVTAPKKHPEKPEKIVMQDISSAEKEKTLHLEKTVDLESTPAPLPIAKPKIPLSASRPPIETPEKPIRPVLSTWPRRIRQLAYFRCRNVPTKSAETPPDLPILTSRRTMAPRATYQYFPHKIALVTVIFLAILIAAATGYLQRQKYQQQSSVYAAAAQKAEVDLRNARKIDQIENPTVFADFSQTEEKVSPSFIAITKDNLLSTDFHSLNSYLKLLQNGGSGKLIAADMATGKKWRRAALFNENTIILLDTENNFYQYDFANKKLSPLPLKLPFGQIEIADFLIYSNNLYILDSQNQQIIKCPDLEGCQTWLKEKTSIPPSASFAADSSIYLLDPSQNILIRYYNGRQQETISLKIRPVLSTASEIKTGKRFKNLYLMDSVGRRLIVINKKGELLKQYTSPEFANLSDLEINSDESQLFVATDKKIYKIDLNE